MYCFVFDLDTFMKLRYILDIFIATSLKIIADNQHNLGKLRRVKVHSHSGQWRAFVMFTHPLP